jgi:hypothetical protein
MGCEKDSNSPAAAVPSTTVRAAAEGAVAVRDRRSMDFGLAGEHAL